LQSKSGAWLALILITTVALCLPLIDRAPDDFRLTGQDFELDLLNVLSVLGIWFILLVRLIAFLADYRATARIIVNLIANCRSVSWRRSLDVLFLPEESYASYGPFPLLI